MEVIKAIIIIYKMYVVYSFEKKKAGTVMGERENKTNNQKSKPNTTKQRIWGENSQGRKDET